MALKVYAVLMVLGQPATSIGPWPGDVEACRARLPESTAKLDAAFADPATLAKLRSGWPDVERHQVEWACVESERAPRIKDPVRLR
ncbi:hypothetical protein [Methylobacterium frigidaeris]|uniref:Uncharacterized protein n=1 Tax=Methylobacterium frigidaeris TaxID=2038277 RepID=A0AA37HFL5_9HYPH|nr:hypothetical protein [Methylobacterium frigidaeris]PIK70532.1 hypothetical protein CS379_24180 [Methylobacterium frigidaeris]GJD65131.1 hypothetical protein MPEAHAMD_5318 [Methylobacterium frigidaeris]